MKVIMKILLSAVLAYWVAIGALFASIIIYPESAIYIVIARDTVVEVFKSLGDDTNASDEFYQEENEETTSEDDIPDEEEPNQEENEETTSEDDIPDEEEPNQEENEETTPEDDIPDEEEPIDEEEIACSTICIDDPSTVEVECLSACEYRVISEWVGYPVLDEIPDIPLEDDMYVTLSDTEGFYILHIYVIEEVYDEITEEITFIGSWVEFDNIPGVQTEEYDYYYDAETEMFRLLEERLEEIEVISPEPEYTPEEIAEAVAEVEQMLFESMLTMIPITFIVLLFSRFTLLTKEERKARKEKRKLAKLEKKQGKLKKKQDKLSVKKEKLVGKGKKSAVAKKKVKVAKVIKTKETKVIKAPISKQSKIVGFSKIKLKK